MSYEDKSLVCVECGTTFTYSADDQEFHAGKGYSEPRRCPSCRANRRASGGSGYGGASFGGGRQREMHPATCADCGKETQVPFLPSGDRPVYCSDCFSRRPKPVSRGGRW